MKTALEQQIERWEKYGSPLPYSVKNLQDTACYDARGNGDGKEREFVVLSLDRAAFNQGENAKYDFDVSDNGSSQTIIARDPNAVVYCLQGNGIGRADTAGCGGCGWRENVCYTLNTIDIPAVCYNTIKNEDTTPQYIVRRITPLECGRLQGMPDWYVADIPHSDANEYKLWGNGMALPNALYIMEGFIDFD